MDVTSCLLQRLNKHMQTSTGDCLPLQHCQTYIDKFTLILRLFELAPREVGTNLDLRAILLSSFYRVSYLHND